MAGDFLFRNLTQKDREGIKKEAKKIVDSFSKKLEKIKNLPPEPSRSRETGYRFEESINSPGPELKKKILNNAKNKNEDFIIAEEKTW